MSVFPIMLGTSRVTACLVSMPARGVWDASVDLDEPAVLARDAAVTLKLGELELAGVVHDGRPYAATARYQVHAGRGGWRKSVAGKSYQATGGAKLSKVLTDLARACGEEFVAGFGPGFTDRSVGNHTRFPGAAGLVLAELAGRAWYVDDEGKTVIGDRVAGAARASVLDFDARTRRLDLDTDEPDKVRPGQTIEFDGAQLTLERVAVSMGKRLQVWATARRAA